MCEDYTKVGMKDEASMTRPRRMTRLTPKEDQRRLWILTLGFNGGSIDGNEGTASSLASMKYIVAETPCDARQLRGVQIKCLPGLESNARGTLVPHSEPVDSLAVPVQVTLCAELLKQNHEGGTG